MVYPQIERISAMRRVLENPYAYVEELEAQRAEFARQLEVTATANEVAASRRLLENPYAHLDSFGGISGVKTTANSQLLERQKASTQTEVGTFGPTPPAKLARLITYTNSEIEQKVHEIHEQLWRARFAIWGRSAPSDPIQLLDPTNGLGLFGYACQLDDGLGRTRGAKGMLEVAGIIDRTSKTVRISSQFSKTIQTFTAAHEFGHAVLHQHVAGVHRDKPLDGITHSRERTEYEADKFATYFLMPAKLVKARFEGIFGVAKFVLTEESAFALVGTSLWELRAKLGTRRDLARRLAGAERYNGFHIQSISKQFGVSTETMAIRLEELDLLPV